MFIVFDRDLGVMQFKTIEELHLYKKMSGFDGNPWSDEEMQKVAKIALAKSIEYKTKFEVKSLTPAELKILIEAIDFYLRELLVKLKSDEATTNIFLGLVISKKIGKFEDKRNYLRRLLKEW